MSFRAITLALAVTASTAALAKDGPPPAESATLAKFMACKALTDPTQRLACLDARLTELQTAEKAGDIVVVDRAQVHTLRRQSFGLPNMDALKFFERGIHPEEVKSVTVTLKEAHRTNSGAWLMVTNEGEVWRQTDGTELFPEPAKGDQATIRSGLLGSYFLKVGNGRAIQVHREE
jgi:hypothetical protein